MNHSLGFSFIGDNNNNNIEGMTNNKKENNKRFSKNKTRKNAPPSSSSRVESMMAKIHENAANKDDDDEDGLATFDPPPRSVSSGVERMKDRDNRNDDDDDEQVTTENFDEMQGNQWQQEYYKQHIPMYTNAASNDVNTSSELLEKLNYMIHLLEEERDVKHGNVTEEVVLYCFLGVFVIFVVDSFAKVGKYVR